MPTSSPDAEISEATDQPTPPTAVDPDGLRVYHAEGLVGHDVIRELQAFLNDFRGVQLKEDGVLGPHSCEAFERVTGYTLVPNRILGPCATDDRHTSRRRRRPAD